VIRIDSTLISDDIVDRFFECPVARCGGLCCVEGDVGAPLEVDEAEFLDAHARVLEQFVSPAGRAILRGIGTFVQLPEETLATPLLPSGQCTYAVSKNGILKCGMERAFQLGAFPFPKPISCHLYPIRIRETVTYTILNLHQWDICDSARLEGRKQGTKVFRFLKTALIRKFSQAWYDKLLTYAEQNGK